MNIIELSHLIDEDIPVFSGFPSPKIEAYLTHKNSRSHYDGQAEFHISKFELVASVGTYMDAPYHRHKGESMISDIPLSSLLEIHCVVVDHDLAKGRGCEIGEIDIKGKAVLFRTGWSKNWRTEKYYENPPYLSTKTIDYLVSQKPFLVGVDFGNVDNTSNPARPAHTKLLGEGILIVESLTNLGALPDSGVKFNAVPMQIKGISTSPIRAFVKL